MITLIRWILLKQKEIKLKLAFYTFIDKSIRELNTGELKDKLLKEIAPFIAELAHSQAAKEPNTERSSTHE